MAASRSRSSKLKPDGLAPNKVGVQVPRCYFSNHRRKVLYGKLRQKLSEVPGSGRVAGSAGLRKGTLFEGRTTALRFLFVKTLRLPYLPDHILFAKRQRRLPTVLDRF